ncbi:UDP-glucose 4-epimerase family protein [Vibrio vulnificus]|uniref:UDP-glucose 4-epimerase family protein n=1 Tax=Vibrio vulnificus TaxID=672 RepID=UPI000D3E9058|nr:SDR family oxidoreductase [Vibrio vulnificus]MBN8140605.1 SDR family oxidoreductase [Vibrio vulnificus]MBN8149931.1 SDR family oxidoreductase [Vibrio vulnificus]NIG91385.1 SDR family oxidoreductase [Vibrio vulnificus]PUZ80432.1 UDP-glucose 4-epimerase [Vibrio vulnificus]
MSCKILVTGASGFIGKRLVKLLNHEGYNVLSILRSPENDNKSSLVFPSFDATTDFSQALTGCDYVVHCAARVHVMKEQGEQSLELYREVNTLGTINLAKQAMEAGVKRFIFVSSVKVNGEHTELGRSFRMDDNHAPEDNYGLSKSEAELKLMQLCKHSEMDVVVIRPTLVYGPGVKANFASLMSLVSKGIPLPFGSITDNRRSLVSLDNLVDLIMTCIESERAANQIFLVSDDHDISTSEMVREMSVALGKPERQFPFPVWCYRVVGKLFNKSDVVDRLTGSLQVDITHTKETLGWTPPQSLQEGFKQTAETFLQSKKNNGKV